MPASIFSEPSLSASMVEDLEADYSGVFRNVEEVLGRLQNVSSVDMYERLQKIGQGTFGEVFKARHRVTKQHFALKRIRMEQEKEGVRCVFNLLKQGLQVPNNCHSRDSNFTVLTA